MKKDAYDLTPGKFYKTAIGSTIYYYYVRRILNATSIDMLYYYSQVACTEAQSMTNADFWKNPEQISYDEFAKEYKGTKPIPDNVKPITNPLLIF